MDRYRKLTLLHSNDLHGAFFPEDRGGVPTGGMSLLSGLVGKIREEEENVLYAIAGDLFLGSVIDAEFKGLSTIELVNMLSPDVVTVGNHEADYGLAHLLFLEKCALFPVINANLRIKANGARLFSPYYIAEVGGMKILFIGVITEDVLAETKKDALISSAIDIDPAIEAVGRVCNAYNALDVDLTVLLTHIGFEEDKRLAAALDPAWSVDLIIGGHSHTAIDAPAVVNGIPIAQAGFGTSRLGRFDLVIDTEKNVLMDWSWRCLPVSADVSPRDVEIEETLEGYKTLTDKKYSRVITRFARPLSHPARNRETQLGDLFADAIGESIGLDLMLLASGSIRSEALGPVVLYADLMEAFPFDDQVYMLRLKGKTLRKMLRYMLREETFAGRHTEFYQVSSPCSLVWDREKGDFIYLTLDGEEVADERVYTVGLQTYHWENAETAFNVSREELEEEGQAKAVSTSCRDVIEEYIGRRHLLYREGKGRITVV